MLRSKYCHLHGLNDEDLVKHGEDSMTYVNGCRNPKSLTILIHGGTSHVIDEIER